MYINGTFADSMKYIIVLIYADEHREKRMSCEKGMDGKSEF